jgi:hypothetical protein
MAASLVDHYNIVPGHEFGLSARTAVTAACLALAACVGHIRDLGHGAVAEWLKAAVC